MIDKQHMESPVMCTFGDEAMLPKLKKNGAAAGKENGNQFWATDFSFREGRHQSIVNPV